ncbi:hypothetical protein EDB86DRAFT_2828352 [Lactarius hatsudake]|nr:hypothetical protein EDB86DRAFT_2828352 [Lactarius hatsudake]
MSLDKVVHPVQSHKGKRVATNSVIVARHKEKQSGNAAAFGSRQVHYLRSSLACHQQASRAHGRRQLGSVKNSMLNCGSWLKPNSEASGFGQLVPISRWCQVPGDNFFLKPFRVYNNGLCHDRVLNRATAVFERQEKRVCTCCRELPCLVTVVLRKRQYFFELAGIVHLENALEATVSDTALSGGDFVSGVGPSVDIGIAPPIRSRHHSVRSTLVATLSRLLGPEVLLVRTRARDVQGGSVGLFKSGHRPANSEGIQ